MKTAPAHKAYSYQEGMDLVAQVLDTKNLRMIPKSIYMETYKQLPDIENIDIAIGSLLAYAGVKEAIEDAYAEDSERMVREPFLGTLMLNAVAVCIAMAMKIAEMVHEGKGRKEASLTTQLFGKFPGIVPDDKQLP